MPKKKAIKDIVTLPNGIKLRGYEVDFKTISDQWDIYETSDDNTLRMKTVLLKVYRLVEDDNQPSRNPITGDPEYYVNTTINVVASSGVEDGEDE